MTDEEKLLIALLNHDDDSEVFTMLEIVAALHEIGAAHRSERELVPA